MSRHRDKNNVKKSLALNATLNTIKTVLGMLLSLLTFPYATRVLGVEALGAYNFSSSIVSYAVLFAGLGVESYSIREGSQYRNDKAKMELFVSEVFSISMMSMMISYVVLFFVVAFSNNLHNYSLMIVILSSEILFSTLGVTWIGNIYEDFLYITIRTLAFQVGYVVALFAFVHSPKDIYVYAVITTLTSSGANILNFFYLRKKYVRFHFTFKCNWKNHLKPILIIFSTKIAITIYVNSDKTILGLLTNDYQVGLYSVAVKIYSIIKEILVAMVTVLIPRFSVMLNTGSRDETNNFFSKVFCTLSVLLIPASVGLFVMAPEIIYTIAGAEYFEASVTLRILSIATIFSLYANIFTTCILVPVRKEKLVFYSTIISALINVGLNFILIPIWGMNAAAATTVIAELITLIMAAFWSHDYIKLIGVRKNIITIIIACIAIVILCIILKAYISSVYMRLMLGMTLSALVYGILLIVTKNNIANEFLKTLMKKKL